MSEEIREVVITIKNESGIPSTPNPSPTPNVTKPESNDNSSALTSVLLHEAFNYAKSDIQNVASYEINKYFTMNDDYIGQRNLNEAKAIVSKAVSSGTQIMAGFSMGGVTGAIIAATHVAISTGLSMYQSLDAEQIQIRQNEAQLSFTRERSGYSLTSESIGENR